MTRTTAKADPWLVSVAAAQSEMDQPDALFAALDRALKSAIGHKLFTILTYEDATGEAARVYSNLPGPYPTGGRKRLAPGPWTEAVLDRGEAYIGRTQDDLRNVFSDHQLIVSLGCESVLNMPVRWRGRTLGSLNLLHEAHWYGEDDVAACLPFAQLTLPALLAPAS
ncbi:GAF domain-containing protein [Bradyrhizobium guangdongense]|uniref:GAF domain-containing protein n=1 Tax=Bradyrhizobium guangdongense TaxID=1325090 RepID=A0A410V1H8_9BRAD|nr:GAF domain-containing protein [Bradyrhizobium guangdongense]QAU37498.1 GAF domain-containing protein [Bradyrhizobium guangdongense]QOZ58556.1 GAF domain-containing protein [Bradyrhizobium guangdongense]GGI20221.1 GAF domain-containing protein [Bradyrhizobium guangdongense]